MIRPADPRQMAFNFDAPVLRSILKVLIEAGTARDESSLTWRGIPNEIDPPAPSRAYTSPVLVYVPRRFSDYRDHLYRLPAVHIGSTTRRVVDLLSDRIEENDRNVVDHRPWWHAVDLMNEEWWSHLLQTRHMTEDRCIERGVVFALHYGDLKKSRSLTTRTARRVLSDIGSLEPDDRSEAFLQDQKRFGVDMAESWVINPTHAAGTGWAMVHGIEDGWLKRGRDGHAGPTRKLLDARGLLERERAAA